MASFMKMDDGWYFFVAGKSYGPFPNIKTCIKAWERLIGGKK